MRGQFFRWTDGSLPDGYHRPYARGFMHRKCCKFGEFMVGDLLQYDNLDTGNPGGFLHLRQSYGRQ